MKTNLVLGAIAIGLFAFITLYEQHTLTSVELRASENQLLQRFVRNRVDRVEIERGGATTVLERTREADEMLGTWNMREPVDTPADDDAVGSLLSAVQYASARRSLADVSDEDLTRFGLDSPRLVARFGIANEIIELRFGSDDPTESGLYMQVDEDVHVVGRDVFEAIDYDAGHFRSKRLLEEGVVLAETLVLEGEGGERRLEFTEGRWRVGAVMATRALVEEALQAFNDVQVESFVDGELGEVWLRASANVPAVEGDEGIEAAEAREVTLEVGELCADESTRKVRVDDGDVGCVLVSRLDAMLRPAEDFRELRPITPSDLELEELTLRSGNQSLVVAQPEGRWTWTLRRGAAETTGDADDEALAAWLQSIRRARAQSVASAENLQAYGLARPAATLEVVDSSDVREVLHIGSVSTEGLYLRRGEEPVVLVVPVDAEDLFRVSALPLRPRRLVDESESSVTRLGVTRGRQTERLERGEDGWVVTSPVAAPAATAVREGLRSFMRLQAERFVADAPAADHGLSAPALVLAAHLEPEDGDAKDITLRIGAATEGGFFGQLEGDPAVFVVDEAFVRQMQEPLVSRRMLRTEVVYLDRLVVEGEGRRVELTHDGRVFSSTDGPLETEFSEALANAIERISASGAVHYGPAGSAEGLSPPRARIEVERDVESDPPRRYVLLIGAPTGEGSQTYLRREDIDVTFTVDESSVAAFLRLLR